MNVVAIYGAMHKGSTYAIAQEVIKNLNAQRVEEFFLPGALPEFCVGCSKCFIGSPSDCPHSGYTMPLREKLLQADVIILASPVYSYYASGQMKVFLDHFANMWIVHRPEQAMFRKQGIVIATAAGPVCKKTLGVMKDSLDMWGVSKTLTLGGAVMATQWSQVSPKTRQKLLLKAKKAAQKLIRSQGRSPCFRVRKWFALTGMMQKHMKLNPVDAQYWEENGWTQGKRPWK